MTDLLKRTNLNNTLKRVKYPLAATDPKSSTKKPSELEGIFVWCYVFSLLGKYLEAFKASRKGSNKK